MEYGLCDYPIMHILPYRVDICVGKADAWNTNNMKKTVGNSHVHFYIKQEGREEKEGENTY